MTNQTTNEIDLAPDAELAAKGDESALDRLFAALGGSAWGVGFAAADAVGPAADAVAKGFCELLQLFDNGLVAGDIRTELLRATRASALRSLADGAPEVEASGKHAREPLSLLGETKDRQATLALTALPEEMRSALWLSEAEGFSITKTAQLLGETHKATEELVRSARSGFRGYYVDAVKRDSLAPGCSDTLDKLAAYVGRTLPAGDVANVEHHLAECKECRSIVMKLDDLEARLHAAIPPLPAWTRQQVADTWTNFVPLVASIPDTPGKKSREKAKGGAGWIGLVAVAAAAAIVLIGSGALSSSHSTSPKQQATEQQQQDDGGVSTPTVAPTSSTDVPPTTPPTTPTQPSTTEAQAPAVTQAPSTTARKTTPTTARRTTTTTTEPNTGFTLVNLPPTPIK